MTTKNEFVAAVAKQSGCDEKTVKNILGAAENVIHQELHSNGSLKIGYFGEFELKRTQPRPYYAFGYQGISTPRNIIKFKAGPALRD